MKIIHLFYNFWDFVEDKFIEVEDSTSLTSVEKKQIKNRWKKDAKAWSLIQ